MTLDELTTPLTVDEVKASIYDVLSTLGVSTTNWKPGAVVRTIIAAVAIVLAALSQLCALIARAGFLDTSTGNWLTLVAQYVYGVARIEASFAEGEVLLSNSSGGVYTLGVGDLVVASSLTGKLYVNTVGVTVGALATNVSVVVQAQEAGADSTAFIGEIDTVVSALTGVTVTNPAVLVAFDEEEDEALRQRCRDKLGALSPNGPPDAYRYVATTATRLDGSAIGVNRVRSKPDGVGGLDVYLATAAGAVTGTIGNTATDLGRVDDLLQTLATPLCVTLRTHSGTPSTVNVTCSVWMYNSVELTDAAVTDAINRALSDWFAARPIGGDFPSGPPGYVYRSALIAAISGAVTLTGVKLPIFRVDLAAPAADVAMGFSDIPTLGTVSIAAITRVTP